MKKDKTRQDKIIKVKHKITKYVFDKYIKNPNIKIIN